MNTTNADYFTFNVHNSIFLTGQTGSGKSYLVHELVKRFEKAYSSDEMKYAFFDLKQCEFGEALGTVKPEYLLFDIQVGGEQSFLKLEGLAELAVKRAHDNLTKPFIFVYLEECDMAVTEQGRFDKAVTTINENANAANMKFIYSTSRPSKDVISKQLLSSFDLILSGHIQEFDAEYLGVKYIPVFEANHDFQVSEL
ncbi:MAG: hypothetical protein JWN75_978 [Candidatus Saccharibacteria bacterium]|nr:hypothetical protein [Candidatus Saccharibacteria bacterium]